MVQGQKGQMFLGELGVSIFVGNHSAPSLRWRWETVTDLHVEGPEELKERVTVPRLMLLGLLAWGFKAKEGASYVTVNAHGSQELYFAVPAPVPELRSHWGDILARFSVPAADTPATTDTSPADLVAKLTQLASLHSSGALTDEEYAAAKAMVINDGGS